MLLGLEFIQVASYCSFLKLYAICVLGEIGNGILGFGDDA